MSFEIALHNSTVFTPASIPIPSKQKIINVIYHKKKYINACVTERQKSAFIRQWFCLIDVLAGIFQREIGKNLYLVIYDRDGEVEEYNSLINRLKCGITDSITNPGDGLLPFQKSTTFVELKKYIECICYFYLSRAADCATEDNTTEKNILKRLYGQLTWCGPGLFTYFQQAYFDLYSPPPGLFSWLAESRELIVAQLASQFSRDEALREHMQMHAYSAFAQFAKESGWHLLREHQVEFRDGYAGLAVVEGRREVVFSKLREDFFHRYRSEAISYLSECLSAFLREQFRRCAVRNVISSSRNDSFQQFFKAIIPVLDSFQLPAYLFLITTNQINPTAMQHMETYVAVALQKCGLLDVDMITLFYKISTFDISNNIYLLESVNVMLDAILPEQLYRSLQDIFNENPPFKYCSSARQRLTGSFFSMCLPFNQLVRSLAFQKQWDWGDRLAVIFRSSDFHRYMSHELNFHPSVIQILHAHYPLPLMGLREHCDATQSSGLCVLQ